jgi:hypothetical protein
MAIGNHDLKGNWADFVKQPTIKIKIGTERLICVYQLQQKNQKRHTSPRRLVKSVVIDPLREDQLR